MKKLLISFIVLSMLTGILTGCGSKSTPADEGSTLKPTATENSSPNKAPDNELPGTELSTFMTNYTTAKANVWEAMSKKFEEEETLAFAMGSLGFAFADLAIVDIALFDSLTVKDGDSFKGKLMFSNIDAFKKVKGDIIEFGYDFVYKEDKSNYKNGDHEITTGKFDKKNNTLYYERTTERNNKKISRMIVEVVQNSENSYSSQLLFFGSLDSDKDSSSLNGYLTWFNAKDINSILSVKNNIDINFNYNSILGKKNIKPEEMAADMEILSKTSLIDGKATFEDLENK